MVPVLYCKDYMLFTVLVRVPVLYEVNVQYLQELQYRLQTYEYLGRVPKYLQE